MREVKLGDETVTIVASPITLYIYTREFGPKADLIGDLMSFQALADGRAESVRFLVLAQMLWAMAKTAKLGAEFPSFEDWLKKVDLDFGDAALWDAVLAEAAQGLFRSTAGGARPAGASKPAS